jgi:hypothetical protein
MNYTKCNIPLVPFNTRTATLFFWTHLFQWLTTGQTADPNKLIKTTTNVQGHFRDMSCLAKDLT